MVKSRKSLKKRALKGKMKIKATKTYTLKDKILNYNALILTSVSFDVKLEDGKKAKGQWIISLNYSHGSGPGVGYLNMEFEKGDFLSCQLQTMSITNTKTKGIDFSGVLTVLSGKGIFKGVSGCGKIEGQRKGQLKNDRILDANFEIILA